MRTVRQCNCERVVVLVVLVVLVVVVAVVVVFAFVGTTAQVTPLYFLDPDINLLRDPR
jgi:hypothetical protein